MIRLFNAPFRYEPDEDDPESNIFTVRDVNGKYICHTNNEESAQAIEEALGHYFIEED
jgi:hypothetical protein